MPAFFDAHNHLQDALLTPHRPRVLADLAKLPVRRAVVNGTSEFDWADTAALAEQHGFVLPSYGLHPWNVGNASPSWRDELRRYVEADPHAGIGEIGIDRWILDRARPDDPRLAGRHRASLAEQTAAFRWQLELAADRNRAVTIHCLDAWGTLLESLPTTLLSARGFLLHAYGGSAELAREFAALGAYFSFNGSFLSERQAAKRTVFARLPLDRLLVETDAPAMPLPLARQTHSLPSSTVGNSINHPGNIEAAYAGLAAIRKMSVEQLAPEIERNFHRLFG